MGPATTAMVATVPTCGLGVLALLYKIGSLVGDIQARISDLERRASEIDASITAAGNNYQPRR